MTFFRRLRMLPGQAPSWMVLGLCLVTALLLVAVAALSLMNPNTGAGPKDGATAGLWLFLLACCLPFPVLTALAAFRLADDRRARRMRAAGSALGLRAIGRIGVMDLGSYAPLPLLRFVRRCKNLDPYRPLLSVLFLNSPFSATTALEGEVEGVPVRVFDLGFQLTLHAPRPGQPSTYRHVQTVAILPARGPCFFRGPDPCRRDEINPHWVRDVGLDQSADLGPIRGRRSVLHAMIDPDLAEVFPADVLAQLAGLDDLIVECSGDHLLVYREDRTVAPEDLDAFLGDVRRASAAVATLARPARPRAEPGAPVPGDRIAPPSRGIRLDE